MRSRWAGRSAKRLAARPGGSYFTGMSLQLTSNAARRVAAIADKLGKPAVLRLSVDGGGCAGFSYKFEMGEAEDGDLVSDTDGVRLVVDPTSLDLIDGSTVDFVEDLGGSAFKVTNPNAASGCGCGSSFSI